MAACRVDQRDALRVWHLLSALAVQWTQLIVEGMRASGMVSNSSVMPRRGGSALGVCPRQIGLSLRRGYSGARPLHVLLHTVVLELLSCLGKHVSDTPVCNAEACSLRIRLVEIVN